MKVIDATPNQRTSASLRVQEWSSHGELDEHLRGLSGSWLLLGRRPEGEAGFYSVTLPQPGGTDVAYGVVAERHGLAPCVLMQDPALGLVIGFNREVVGVEAGRAQIRFRHQLDALFWTFLPVPLLDTIVVIHEIGASAMNPEGRTLWRYSKDLVTDYAIHEDKLLLTFSDHPPVALHLRSGEASTATPGDLQDAGLHKLQPGFESDR
jgi:hypothetical protein